MQYLSERSEHLRLGRFPDCPSAVAELLRHATVLLRAFTHAATDANPSSSRCGSAFTLLFDRKGAQLAGAEVRLFNPERQRVAAQAAGECNFHVFYQLCAGASPEQCRELLLMPAADFFILSQVTTGGRPPWDP